MTIGVGAALIFGFAIDAWVFTPKEWNPHWVGDVAVLPGVYLGGLVWVALGRREGFEVLWMIAGMASEWLLIGALAGIVVHQFRGRLGRRT